jgi:tetratricopeptide (TPR) repeat protein
MIELNYQKLLTKIYMKQITIKIDPWLILKTLIVILILVFYGSILFHKINLPTDDLGRHLTNGKIIWETKNIAETNFYSYTEPDFPFLNHHWLSGVIFYFLFLLAGFNGLIIFKIILLLISFSLIFSIAAKKGNFWLAAIASIPAIFILSERTDIRPEIFSFFFTALFLYLLIKFSDNPKNKTIFWLIPLQILWVNLHIYFFIGPAMALGFLAEKIIRNRKNLKNNPLIKKLLIVFLLLFAACFLNPAGWKTVFYPLNIFKNYGYDIAENKSPFFLEHLMHNPSIPFFKLSLGLLIISFVISLIFRDFSIFYFLAALATSIAGILIIRNFPLFALIFLPATSISLKNFSRSLVSQIKNSRTLFWLKILSPLILIILLSWAIMYSVKNPLPQNKEKGIGLAFESNNSAEFLLQKNIKGPIFNNYDIGSYLIYHLYPKEKIFVDNRPEAYPKLFFDGTYLPMQMDEIKWREIENKYNFNTIFFTQEEGTWWGRNFLTNRFADTNWAIIYADSQAVIIVKNNLENKELIKKYQITKDNIAEKISYLANSSNIKTKFTAVNLFELIDRNDLAFNICQEITKNNPSEARAWLEMGSIKSSEKNTSAQIDAGKYLEKAIELGENLPGIYNQLGLVYFNLGQFAKAKSIWQKALSIDPENQNANNYLKQYQELNLP